MGLKIQSRRSTSVDPVILRMPLPAWRRMAPFILLLFNIPVHAQTRFAHTALGLQAAQPVSNSFTDEIGRNVKVPAKVNRIVSLAPNLTEIVFALGEGDHLAGDTDFCDYPPEAALKPRVGGPVNPNLEQVVALMPDLVLATKAINRRETVDGLARIGVPVYVTDPHSVDDMIASIEHIGKVLHSEEIAAPLAENLRKRLSSLDRRLAGTVPRHVLFVVWTNPMITIGRGTFIADALRRAGARSVVDVKAEWPRINFEEILRQQPEFLVFATGHPAETQREIDSLRTRPGWRDMNALRRGNIVIISDAINRPAPRMVDAVEQLARAFHSESFSSRDAQLSIPVQIAEEGCACIR